MEWVLRSPQIHSTFSNLGFIHGDGYHINDNCNAALNTILHNILTEDKYLRTYRRSISFGQNVKKDLIPLLIHAKEEKTIELLISILVNVTAPVEGLLLADEVASTDFGRHTIFEINNLLSSTKVAFADHRTTKVVIDFLRKNLVTEQQTGLSPEQCTNISNSLLLIRNILHISEDTGSSIGHSPNHNDSGSNHSVQNQILWNIFSQSIDKILIKLMTVPEAVYVYSMVNGSSAKILTKSTKLDQERGIQKSLVDEKKTNWGVTMVQIIALLYKDQHVVTLHKYLNLWLEASLSESSEDNESNTSPPIRGSDVSSPMLTSDPTSDSSDTEGSRKSNDDPNSENKGWASTQQNDIDMINQTYMAPSGNNHSNVEEARGIDITDSVNSYNNDQSIFLRSNDLSNESPRSTPEEETKEPVISEISDCGYGTQIENQVSVSTSSNETDMAISECEGHQKPHNPLHRNNNGRSMVTIPERKRKRIVKRGKANIINVRGLSHQTPTDDVISNVLKEFMVDFLLKGYNSLVQTLHDQMLANAQLEMDTSHFFWLVTYFLKFATQLELDLEHVGSVLSFEIVSYLTAEGVNLCEQFELALKLDGNHLKPNTRKLHLVVTAIREFVQAVEVYKKLSHISDEDQSELSELQIKMCETDELRSLMVLLLRHYDPKYNTKQYLQDLIVTNHILLIFMDNVMRSPEYKASRSLFDHIKQFAAPEIMYHYGELLEDYASNSEFVNDCIFTMMHHVGGELESVISLFQPKILKIFTSIWKSEFEICDDWSDLIEYVINTFIKKPHTLQSTANFRLDTENFDEEKNCAKAAAAPAVPAAFVGYDKDAKMESLDSKALHPTKFIESWTDELLSSLSWNYMQCSSLPDVVGGIVKMFAEDGIHKSRESVIKGLFQNKNLINQVEYERLLKEENVMNTKTNQMNKEMRDDEIGKLCEQLIQDGKRHFLYWVQKILLDTCIAKIYVEKNAAKNRDECDTSIKEFKITDFALFKKINELPVMSPVPYYSLLRHQSVPLVPWNCEQASICKDLRFLQLLHKLGFHMPVDTGKVFIRIPHFWTADILFDVAEKIAPIDTKKLKYLINEISDSSGANNFKQKINTPSMDVMKHIATKNPEDFYEKHSQGDLETTHKNIPSSTLHPDESKTNVHVQDWLKVLQNSNDYEISTYLESICETASVASDLTRMYVSDEDERPEKRDSKLTEKPTSLVMTDDESTDGGRQQV